MPPACACSSNSISSHSTGWREACGQGPLPATWQLLLLRLLHGPSRSTLGGLAQGAKAGLCLCRRACETERLCHRACETETGAARARRSREAAATAPATAGAASAAAWPRPRPTGALQGAGALTRARPLRSSSCTLPALPRCSRGRASSPSAAAAAAAVCWMPILPRPTAALASGGRAPEGPPGRARAWGLRCGRSNLAHTARLPRRCSPSPTLPAPGVPAGPLAWALPTLPGSLRTCLRCEAPPACCHSTPCSSSSSSSTGRGAWGLPGRAPRACPQAWPLRPLTPTPTPRADLACIPRPRSSCTSSRGRGNRLAWRWGGLALLQQQQVQPRPLRQGGRSGASRI
jgi:hypothetical protein